MNTFLHIEHLCHGAVVLAELRQEAGGDGQQIAARQSFDLARVSEGGAHHHGAVAELLVVVVNLCHAHHACEKGRRALCLRLMGTSGENDLDFLQQTKNKICNHQAG